MYTDQTGAFPTRSRSGIRYIMIMCEMDGNAIMSEGLRNRTVGEIIKAYQKLILTKSRHTPKETHVGQRVNRRIQTSTTHTEHRRKGNPNLEITCSRGFLWNEQKMPPSNMGFATQTNRHASKFTPPVQRRTKGVCVGLHARTT